MVHKKQPPPSGEQGGGENLGNTGKPCLPSPAPNCKHAALSNRLPMLAAEIMNAHAEARRAAQMTVEHAIRAGDALLEAKALMPHGAWLPWLRDHCQMSERSAQRYMRLARNKDEITKNRHVSDLTLRGAALLLGNLKTDNAAFSEPFTDEDFAFAKVYPNWIAVKLAHVAELPKSVRHMVLTMPDYGLPGLALASGTEIMDALKRVAAYIPRPPRDPWLKHNQAKWPSVFIEDYDSLDAEIHLILASQHLFVLLWKELEAREKLDEEAQWQRAKEVSEQLQVFLAEAKVALAEARRAAEATP